MLFRSDGRVEIGYDLMVIDIAEEIEVRPAVVADKPWPVRAAPLAGSH